MLWVLLLSGIALNVFILLINLAYVDITMLMKSVFKLKTLAIHFSVIFAHPAYFQNGNLHFTCNKVTVRKKKKRKKNNPKTKKLHQNKQTKNVLQAYTDS